LSVPTPWAKSGGQIWRAAETRKSRSSGIAKRSRCARIGSTTAVDAMRSPSPVAKSAPGWATRA